MKGESVFDDDFFAYLLKQAFGDDKPLLLLENPHCIFRTSPEVLKMISNVTGSKLGIWGNSEPLYDYDGGTFVRPENRYMAKYFKLWKTKRNTDLLLNEGVYFNACGFTMCIDADTESKLLIELFIYKHEIRDCFDHFEWLNIMRTFIDKLKWIYFPMNEQFEPFGAFVVAKDKQNLLDSFILKLRSDKIETYKVIMENGNNNVAIF